MHTNFNGQFLLRHQFRTLTVLVNIQFSIHNWHLKKHYLCFRCLLLRLHIHILQFSNQTKITWKNIKHFQIVIIYLGGGPMTMSYSSLNQITGCVLHHCRGSLTYSFSTMMLIWSHWTARLKSCDSILVNFKVQINPKSVFATCLVIIFDSKNITFVSKGCL